MGSAKRIRPKRLGEKLLAIRIHFDCSLAQMADRLSDDEIIVRRTDISKYELNQREPSLLVLLQYKKLSKNITIDILADDEQDLPNL